MSNGWISWNQFQRLSHQIRDFVILNHNFDTRNGWIELKIKSRCCLTSDNEVDTVQVTPMLVGDPEHVHVTVCGMGAIDPQAGHVAVFAVGLLGSLCHESAVPSSCGEDDAVACALAHVTQVPCLIWLGVRAEQNL